MRLTFVLSTLIVIFTAQLAHAKFTANVMAPLAVGDILHPDASPQAWKDFDQQLARMKNIGVTAVSTDVWWGVVEAKEGQFDWSYYDVLVKHLNDAGLKWVPILSFHQCGGNVGDTCDFPIPAWIWQKYSDDLRYKSEQGHWSREYVSVWGTKLVISDYARFMNAFQNHFANQKSQINEINISLGPAGELRYPSYNSHDVGTGYPTRGAIQAFSNLAIRSFRDFIKAKYQDSILSLNQSWGSELSSFEEIVPFDATANEHSSYGNDFFDWYNASLVEHGKLVLTTASEIFADKKAAFQGIDIGAKVPGIHWRIASDRRAELSAGLLSTRTNLAFNKTSDGVSPMTLGYENVVGVFALKTKEAAHFVMHFTCLEKDNFEDQQNHADSMAQALVFWVANEAQRQQVTIKGENALSGPLGGNRAWENLANALQYSSYEGITILRIGELSEFAIEQYGALIHGNITK